MIEMLTTVVSWVLVPALALLGAYAFGHRATKKRERLADEIERLAKERWEVGVSIGGMTLTKSVEIDSEATKAPSPVLLKRVEEQVLSTLAASSGLTKEEVNQEIDAQLADLRDGFARIESRFPEEAKVEKIAARDDTFLSERIDQLAKQVENLEKRVLSRWDVALTVGTIIVGITWVVAATYGVLKITGTGL